MLVLCDAFFVDMPEDEAFVDEGLADEPAAVALQGFALAAEQDHFQFFTMGYLEPFEAFAEKGLPPDGRIVDLAGVVITGWVAGSAAQLVTQVDVADAVTDGVDGRQGGKKFFNTNKVSIFVFGRGIFVL